MATFNKDIVQKYGSLDAFAQADGCTRIYESDDGYHTVRRPADEEAILSSPYVHNAHLVWPARQASAPAPAQAARRPAAAAGPGASVPAVEKTATPPRNFKIITHVLSIFLWGFIVGVVVVIYAQSGTGTPLSLLQRGLMLLLDTLAFGLFTFIPYALGGGLEWDDNGLPMYRKVLYWVLTAFVYGAIFFGMWMVIRFIMAKIYKIPMSVARGRLLSNHPYVPKSKPGRESGLDVRFFPEKVPQQTATATTELGVLFDIDELGGGYYGWKAFVIFFHAIDPQELAGCSLWDGDTQATLAGKARQYCIAIQGLPVDRLEYVRSRLAQCSEKGLLAVERRFLEGEVTGRQPLVRGGEIDLAGRLVVKKGAMISKRWAEGTAWNIIEI